MSDSSPQYPPLRVKFLARTAADQSPRLWTSLFKGGEPVIDGVSFTFDPDARDYDWLIVYEDLMFLPGETRSNRAEPLACARENTLFVTTEPSSIKIYGRHYLRQFGHVLTHQPRDIIDHPGHIYETPPLRWYYGRPLGDSNDYATVDQFHATPPHPKQRDLSTVTSNKQMKDTLHHQRYSFVMALKERLGDDFDVFGRGIRAISDKAEAMDGFRYHVAIENHIEAGHWTEKIADCFLAFCVPFYYGPPDIAEYFPKDSLIPIDIFDVEGSAKVIREELSARRYTERLPAIIAARDKVLTEYNLMQKIAEIVRTRHDPNAARAPKAFTFGRHAFRRRHPVKALSDVRHERRVKRTLDFRV